MDFVDLGKHCEMVGCRQQDFLPFKCPTCSKNLCLVHRRFEDHGCSAPDATSMDCPICHKSIVMDRSADPNLVWDQHFTTSCTQQPSSKHTAVPLCATCRVKLGPSNTFNCAKCGTKVCMAHRMADDHSCAAIRRGNNLSTHHTATGTGSKNSRLLNSNNHQKSSSAREAAAKKVPNKQVDPSNTLAGTAQLRAERLAAASSGRPQITTPTTAPLYPQMAASVDIPGGAAEQFACPMCAQTRSSLDLITRHIEEEHLSEEHNGPISSGNIQSSAASHGSDREVCPYCSARFTEVTALVAHVESIHSTPSENSSCAVH